VIQRLANGANTIMDLRAFVLAAALTLWAAPLAGQDYGVERIGADLPIAVALHPDVAQFDPSVQAQLQSRVTALASSSGMAAVHGGSTFVLFPTLIPVRQERTSGQLRNQTVVTAEISLFLKNASDGHLFASMTRSVTGAGQDETRALMEAVSSLRPRDSQVVDFLREARDGIVSFYDRNCEGVLTEARTAAQVGDVDRGLGILLAVPTASQACHERASVEAVQIVEAYQQAQCERVVRNARAEVAADHFVDAIDDLMDIDPSSPCAKEADAVVERIDAQVQARADAQAAERVAQYNSVKQPIRQGLNTQAKVRERRLTVAGTLAVGYFNQRRSTSYDPSIFNTVGR